MTTVDITAAMSDNQRELLELLRVHRFAASSQLTRFARPRYSSANSAKRQTLRHLASLEADRLVLRLERRVGGWQGGSQVSVWSLTTTGLRALTGSRRRQRPKAVSTTFLAHALATTEVCLVLTEAVRALESTELGIIQEPDCWRRYPGGSGEVITLRPDLAATVTTPEYTDRYFLEVDRATENPARVLGATRRYLAYRATGREQETAGVYPALVWIVPNPTRREQLMRHLEAQPDIPDNLWLVLTLDQIPLLVKDGPDAFTEASE